MVTGKVKRATVSLSGKSAKKIKVKQNCIVKLFTGGDIPWAEIMSCLRHHGGKDVSSRAQISCRISEVKQGEPISTILPASEEIPMKVLLAALLGRSMQTLISQRENSPGLWGLRLQRSVWI